jgi:hypothetical protein
MQERKQRSVYTWRGEDDKPRKGHEDDHNSLRTTTKEKDDNERGQGTYCRDGRKLKHQEMEERVTHGL